MGAVVGKKCVFSVHLNLPQFLGNPTNPVMVSLLAPKTACPVEFRRGRNLSLGSGEASHLNQENHRVPLKISCYQGWFPQVPENNMPCLSTRCHVSA